MSQWFRGKLEGYYVGTGATGPFVSQFGSAARYKMRVYSALIQDVEVLESDDALKESEATRSFYQAEIEDVRLLGVRPRRCFEGTVYDVAIAKMQVTHSTKKGDNTYGRIVGDVVGRFLLPQELADDDKEELADERPLSEVVDSSEPERSLSVVDQQKTRSKQRLSGKKTSPRTSAAQSQPIEGTEDRDIEPLHAPSPVLDADEVPSNVPIPLLGLLVGIALGLFGGGAPALLWFGVLVPILVIRLMLSGQFKVSFGQRVFGAILVVINLGCLGWMGLDYWTLGVLSINIAALSVLALTVLISSLLPSPGALLMTGAGLAVVLFLWYGPIDSRSSLGESEVSAEDNENRGTPTVTTPGKPRTNKDGSWPYRSK